MTSDAFRDGDFYWETVVFLVGERLFKVPKQHFMCSDIFSTTFSLPSGELEAEGKSDERPFVLHGIEADDFHALLKVMFPTGRSPTSTMSRDEWISALRLSTMWEFGTIRSLAIRELAQFALTAVDKVHLGRSCKVQEWLSEGLLSLVQRTQSLTLEEMRDCGEVLGWERTARVLRLRDVLGTRSRIEIPRACASHLCMKTGTMNFCCTRCGNWAKAQQPLLLELKHYEKEIREEFSADFESSYFIGPQGNTGVP